MEATKGLLVGLVVGLGLVVAVGIGGMALFFSAVADVPPYRFDLPGSVWRVASVDGSVLAEPMPRLALDEGAQAALLSFECGDVQLDWYWDSDGNGTGFQMTGRPADCPATDVEREVLQLLTSSEEWRASGEQSMDIINALGTLSLELVVE